MTLRARVQEGSIGIAPPAPGSFDLRTPTAQAYPSVEELLWIATGPVSVDATDEEVSLLSLGLGSLLVPPDRMQGGLIYRLELAGYYSTNPAASNEGRIRVKATSQLGSTLLLDSTVRKIPEGDALTMAWKLTAEIVCRDTGTAGAMYARGQLLFVPVDIGPVLGGALLNGGDVAIDTTIEQALDVSWEWEEAHADNAWVLTNGTLGFIL